MKILQLLYDDQNNPWLSGGGPIAVRVIAAYMARHGHHTTIVCGNHPAAEKEHRDGVTVMHTGVAGAGYFLSRVSYAIGAFFYLARHIAAYDLVVDNTSPYSPTFSFMFSKKKPVIANITAVFQRMALRKNMFYALPAMQFEKMILHCYSFYTAVSPVVRNYIPSSRTCYVVPVGIDLREIPSADHMTEQNYIAFLGRIEIFGKGIDTLLDMLTQASAFFRKEKCICKIAGTGRDEKALQREISRRGIADICRFVGRVDGREKYVFLGRARLLVFPTRFELMPRVPIEAQVCGTPVVGSNIDAMQFVVKTGETGALLPPERTDLFSACVTDLLTDTQKRQHYARNAATYGRQFDRELFLRRRLDAYNEIVSHFPGPSAQPTRRQA